MLHRFKKTMSDIIYTIIYNIIEKLSEWFGFSSRWHVDYGGKITGRIDHKYGFKFRLAAERWGRENHPGDYVVWQKSSINLKIDDN